MVSIGSCNGLAPNRRQAIILSNADFLSIGHIESNVTEILNKMKSFLLKKMQSKPAANLFNHRLVNRRVT